MKTKKVLPMISIMLCALAFATVAYAWTAMFIETTSRTIILSGDVSSSAELYVGRDEDLNGILDTDDDGEDIYNLVPKTAGIKEVKIVTGKMSTYKFVIKNTGTVKAKLDLSFGSVTGEKLIKLFAFENIRYVVSGAETEIIDVENDLYLPHLLDAENKGIVPYFTYDEGLLPGETITVYFQLVCVTFSNLMHKYDSEIPADFFQQINEQIYIEGKKDFKIDTLIITLKSMV